tara:strand:- start:4117 stop:4446 length:330 start_codon:yes stop_codon:yes gene_type:complete
MNEEIETKAAVDLYIKYLVNDFREWRAYVNLSSVSEEKIRLFEDSITVINKRKYIMILSAQSAHSFIVKEDDKKFKKGDILISASSSSPSRKKMMGNIYKGDYRLDWAG